MPQQGEETTNPKHHSPLPPAKSSAEIEPQQPRNSTCLYEPLNTNPTKLKSRQKQN
ncbi:predicted protein [Arabidopsis lyrata subsp. lyrata]|uniref:Predicted protein n=1 Tax=Arabidopsis lyrata subsp. lyrata TaxID=81972 RepID=D7KV20_ARALL|nr:predicted protein [Arabidopsis lyrata subsp. lyrata]